MASNGIRIGIVGGGLAGLAAAMKIAEAGHSVDLFSVVPVKRSHSVCAQGGINGAVNTKGEGDSTWEHFDDTVYGGDFLANQPPSPSLGHPKVYWTFAASEALNIIARLMPELRPDNSCSMLSTSRFAATRARGKSESLNIGKCCR